MNVSQDKLNEYIKLYTNDTHDYHDDENHHKVVESVLAPFTNLNESDKDFGRASLRGSNS